MDIFCTRCGQKTYKNTGLCPACDAAAIKKEQNMKILIAVLSALSVTALVALVIFAILSFHPSKNSANEVQKKLTGYYWTNQSQSDSAFEFFDDGSYCEYYYDPTDEFSPEKLSPASRGTYSYDGEALYIHKASGACHELHWVCKNDLYGWDIRIEHLLPENDYFFYETGWNAEAADEDEIPVYLVVTDNKSDNDSSDISETALPENDTTEPDTTEPDTIETDSNKPDPAKLLTEYYWKNIIQCVSVYEFFDDGTYIEYYCDSYDDPLPENLSFAKEGTYTLEGETLCIYTGSTKRFELTWVCKDDPYEWEKVAETHFPEDEYFFYETGWQLNPEVPSDNATYLIMDKKKTDYVGNGSYDSDTDVTQTDIIETDEVEPDLEEMLTGYYWVNNIMSHNLYEFTDEGRYYTYKDCSDDVPPSDSSSRGCIYILDGKSLRLYDSDGVFIELKWVSKKEIGDYAFDHALGLSSLADEDTYFFYQTDFVNDGPLSYAMYIVCGSSK